MLIPDVCAVGCHDYHLDPGGDPNFLAGSCRCLYDSAAACGGRNISPCVFLSV